MAFLLYGWLSRLAFHFTSPINNCCCKKLIGINCQEKLKQWKFDYVLILCVYYFIWILALGAAYGTAKSGTGIAAMSVMRPELIMKSIIPVVMAGIIAIYGLVVAVLIAGSLEDSSKYSLYKYVKTNNFSIIFGWDYCNFLISYVIRVL